MSGSLEALEEVVSNGSKAGEERMSWAMRETQTTRTHAAMGNLAALRYYGKEEATLEKCII